MSRRTEIMDLEIEDIDELQDELFGKLSDAFVIEKRLLKKYNDFCEQYINFEFDEMGLNMDDTKEILRKADKICNLAVSNVENTLSYNFTNIKSNINTKTISMSLLLDENSFDITISVMSDSFNLELL